MEHRTGQWVMCGRHRLTPERAALAVVALALSLVTVTLNGPAAAQAPPAQSPGCAELNLASQDGSYISGNTGTPEQFFAGERITISAGPPVGIGTPPTQVQLGADGATVDTAAFPGTVSYTFPSATTTLVGWQTNGLANVTWTVNCVAPVAQSPGCAELNLASQDGSYISGNTGTAEQFFAGERITISAGPPVGIGTPPTQVQLGADGATVDTAAFPGTVSYTFPSATTTLVGWQTNGLANVTWTVNCVAPVAQSPGCAELNLASQDGSYISGNTGTAEQFFAGERITISAGPPVGIGTPPTQVQLGADGATVDTAAFPGTVTYTFPDDTMTVIGWQTDGFANVTWTVNCDPAPALSPGCAELNLASQDGSYISGNTGTPEQFFEGERITISAGPPVGIGTPPTQVQLGADGATVDTAAFPGTVTYTFPDDTMTVVGWQTDGLANVTWTVSCAPAIGTATPSISTQASPGNLLGAPVRDTATVTDGADLTGSVTFRLFSNATCTTQVFTSTNPVSNDTAVSDWFTPAAPGTYYWTAAYLGDDNNDSVTSPCGAPGESVVIAPFQPPTCTQTITGDFAGSITVAAGQTVCISNARVFGSVTVSPGGAVTITNSSIANGVAANAPAFFSVCGSQISGPSTVPGRGIVVTNAGVPLRIGDPAAGCAGNRVSGEIILTGNTAGLTLGANFVTRSMSVNGNTGGTPVLKANTIAGTLACSGNNPPPTNAGQPNTASTKTGECAAL